MSYQARIDMPLLIVTGRTGACGNTKRSAGHARSTSSGTIGAKSLPSAPRPCSQMMLCCGLAAVSNSTAGRVMASSRCGGRCIVTAVDPDHDQCAAARASCRACIVPLPESGLQRYRVDHAGLEYTLALRCILPGRRQVCRLVGRSLVVV